MNVQEFKLTLLLRLKAYSKYQNTIQEIQTCTTQLILAVLFIFSPDTTRTRSQPVTNKNKAFFKAQLQQLNNFHCRDMRTTIAAL